MGDYSLTFARSARKELERVDATAARRILAKVEGLALCPRPAGCRKIRGGFNLWRIRVGDYRVVYTVDDAERTVDIVAARPRKNAYR